MMRLQEMGILTISGDRSRGQDRSRSSSPSWAAGGDSAGAVSDGNGLRSSCGVGLTEG